MATKKIITISRERVYRSRLATGPGFAWRYLYTLNGTGEEHEPHAERLDTARRMARKTYGATEIRLAW